ncbi:S8 family serine peptidase [Bacillus suaedaesalsae]|uniref:S8 family serine peptidase n=1 Tax=Bacillus suaedaesalsae TaxID=2810349 RepID=A0ABS2DKZ2_9BACI|nr:S8 family serine peptidase [Bacillus suaedaesalsae]MBM6619159.1 S8 family serine peptidase [Bacillus suaedaesalsae]
MRKGFLVFLGVLLALSSFSFSAFATQQESTASPQSFLVVFKSDSSLPSNYESIIEKAGGKVTYEVSEIGTVEATTSNPTAFIKSLVKNTQVASLAPALEVSLDLPEVDASDVEQGDVAPVPADESIWEAGWQWDIERVTNQGASHEISSGSKDVVVGIIDSGIDFDHPDLKNNIVPGSKTFVPGTTDAWDFNSHGTHVAGTIGANGRIKGIAPEVGLRSYRVFGATGGAQQIWITDAIIAAANDGVDVINMSLGGTRVIGQWYYTDPATGEKIRLGNDAADMVAYNRAIRYATNKGVTVVASAGNDGQDLSNPAKLADWYNATLDASPSTAMYDVQGAAFKVPAQTPGVITVSALGGGFGTEDRLAFYSNYGNGNIDVSAPGGDLGPDYNGTRVPGDYKWLVLSAVPTYLNSPTGVAMFGTQGYGWKGGTSMASPQVAGVAAAYIAKVYEETGKKPSPSQVQTHLQQTAEDAGKNGYDPIFGHGVINAYNAVK